MRRLFLIGFMLFGQHACSSWKEFSANDTAVSNAVRIKGDPETKSNWQFRWQTWVVLKNKNSFPVKLLFRTEDGIVKIHPRVIEPKELVAARIGPEDVKFLFWSKTATNPTPPFVHDQLNSDELEKKYPNIPRL